MSDHTMTVQSWPRDTHAATAPSLECTALFSLAGIVVSAAVLLASSAETIASITASLT